MSIPNTPFSWTVNPEALISGEQKLYSVPQWLKFARTEHGVLLYDAFLHRVVEMLPSGNDASWIVKEWTIPVSDSTIDMFFSSPDNHEVTSYFVLLSEIYRSENPDMHTTMEVTPTNLDFTNIDDTPAAGDTTFIALVNSQTFLDFVTRTHIPRTQEK